MIMRARTILASLVVCAAASACSQTPVVVPLRSMERPEDVDFICLEDTGRGTFRGVSLEMCAANFDNTPRNAGAFRLHAVVSQVSRGELAVVDLGRVPGDPAQLTKADPRIPGYTFIPVGAAPTDVVADPMGSAVFVSSGRDPRIDVLPAAILRGPIDTKAASADPPPWPHIDFTADEGIPASMAIVRSRISSEPEKHTNRLYVTLPDAKGGPKIAVFDLTASAILPARIGDIPLGAPVPVPLNLKTAACGPRGASTPWWTAYDTCGGEPAKVSTGIVTVDTPTKFHLAGVNVVGDKMFVADDQAPVVHVYDIKGGAGIEIRQIGVGATTSRLAVSPAVPDEVTLHTSAAIETCVARGWVGDGLDHSADSVAIKDSLGGRCRAHRYLYAIDVTNPEAGNGSIAIVDLPVTYALDDKNQIKLKDGVPEEERIDFDGAELVQPMACDAPSFSPRRLPVGPFAINSGNTVPARSIAFVEIDPPRVNGLSAKAVRCRPFQRTLNNQVIDTHTLGSPEYEGVPEAEAEARRAIGRSWASGAGPRRLRGVFGWVALSNGALVVVDLDDYDATCRGPKAAADRGPLFVHSDEAKLSSPEFFGDAATGEYFPRAVRRHHPRSLRLFDQNVRPTVGSVIFSRFDAVISNDPTNETGRLYPHFAVLEARADANSRPPVVLPAPDSPYSLSTETWAVTYEGMLPGFTGAWGTIADEGGKLVLRDSSASYCRRGVESDGPIETHDTVQLLDEICEFASCPNRAKCADYFGEATDRPMLPGRSLFVEKAYDDRLALANSHWERTLDEQKRPSWRRVDGPPDLALIHECFGGGAPTALRYTVRASGSWVAVGSTSGYLHRRVVSADPAAEKACITDLTKPRILNGRLGELPPLTNFASRTVLEDKENQISEESCKRFVNPAWKFAIRRGLNPSAQDMRFTFGGRFSWQPFSLGAGSLLASMRPVAAFWDGRERLNWNMIAAVDAIDRGLLVFPALEPFAYQKGAN